MRVHKVACNADATALRSEFATVSSKCDMIARTLLADETQYVTLFCLALGFFGKDGCGGAHLNPARPGPKRPQ